MKQDRRKFLIKSSLASLALAGAPLMTHKVSATPVAIPEKMTVLFQGDSITDAGRAKDQQDANSTPGMGRGYVIQTAAQLTAENFDTGFSIYNRGISGHKVHQLAARWDDDALMLKPDVLSILIGINDYWHMVNGKYAGTVEIYENDFRALLERTKKALPNVKFLICEPFAVWGGKAITERWGKELPGYQSSAAKLAAEFNAGFVPFQAVFNKALKKAPASVWCPDGVHPSLAGGQLMAKAWMKEFNKLY
ncbi:MAG: lysophospholipase L1-like esterase [Cyclobacteriaceae bacterium]|jgi:lysophospholipase L1-like esterase